MSDLQDLFSGDPHGFTEQKIDKIIEEMRKIRHQFKQGNVNAGKTKPKTAKEKQGDAIASQLSLKDLGL